MNVLMQPFIIEKVFEFLSLFDVERCQYVCRVWRESALRSLKKCPIDECRSVITCQTWFPETQNADGERQLVDIIEENHRMNLEGVTYGIHCLSPRSTYHWYLWREPFSDLLPMSEVDQTIQGFLTNKAKCIPGFSFLQYDRESESKFMRGIILNHPTVLIRMWPRCIADGPMIREIGDKIETLKIAYKEKFPHLSVDTNLFSPMSYFDGFHINLYIPGVKIIITDWSDGQNARPNMSDPKFQIKSVLCLASNRRIYNAKIWEIEKLLEESAAKPILSGGALKRLYGLDWIDSDSSGERGEFLPLDVSRIFYADHGGGKPKESSIITIAFAGKEIESAAHDILLIPGFNEEEVKLEKFKQSLDFPVDDGRVMGFILGRYWPNENDPFSNSEYFLEATSKIKVLFPFIKTSTIDLEEYFDDVHEKSKFSGKITLILIRV